MIFSTEQLKQFATNVFVKIGCPEEEARQAADVLVSADLRGVDSHGVARLSGYIRLHEKERLNANPIIKTVHETPSTAVASTGFAIAMASTIVSGKPS